MHRWMDGCEGGHWSLMLMWSELIRNYQEIIFFFFIDGLTLNLWHHFLWLWRHITAKTVNTGKDQKTRSQIRDQDPGSFWTSAAAMKVSATGRQLLFSVHQGEDTITVSVSGRHSWFCPSRTEPGCIATVWAVGVVVGCSVVVPETFPSSTNTHVCLISFSCSNVSQTLVRCSRIK